jgi:sporulation protein YlmC with PRC-barrel domain
MKTYLNRTAAGATLMAVALCLSPHSYAADSSARTDAEHARMAAGSAGHSTRDIIGQSVRGAGGEDLGKIKDLVVSPATGTIVYALVGSGGVLGVGDKLRAVPFSALKTTGVVNDKALNLDINQSKWETAPVLRDEDFGLLSTDERARATYEFYGQSWDRDALTSRQTASTERSNQLMRVSKLVGKDLKNAGREVGEIEDVIVDFKSRRASAVIDPEDDYTGTDQDYLISFSQIMLSPDRKDDLATTLTRADFEGAKPVRDNWWGTTSGYPYVWSGYSYTHGVGYSALPSAEVRSDTVGSVARDVRNDDRRDRDLKDRDDRRMSVASVREALSRDPALADAARHVILREENGKLVIRGTVPTDDLKDKLSDRIDDLAKGWNVDDELEVKAAAE